MSLIIQLEQKTKEFSRLLYLDNNKSEIIESHGSNFLDSQKCFYNYHKDRKKPFEMLPKNYNIVKDLVDLIKVYQSAKDCLDEISKNDYK